MTDELEVTPEEEVDANRVYIGFHQLGGIRLAADDVRLSPQEAFILAGQLTAHATMVIQQNYVEDQMRQRSIVEGIEGGLIVPPGVR